MEMKIKENKEKAKKPSQQNGTIVTNEMIQELDDQIAEIEKDRKSVEREDTGYWKLAAAKKNWRRKETIDSKREREGAKIKWDSDQGTKEIDTASYYRKRTQETSSAAIRIRHEGISPQEEYQTPRKMMRYNFYQIYWPSNQPHLIFAISWNQ